MFVARALLAPLPNDGSIVGIVAPLVPASRSLETIFLEAPSDSNARIDAVRATVLRRGVDNRAHRKAHGFTNNDRLARAKHRKHLEQPLEVVRGCAADMSSIRVVGEAHCEDRSALREDRGI